MREAVNVVLKTGNKIFMIKRQDYLLAFPGYHSFPGGKVDKGDEEHSFELVNIELEERIIGACRRELQEELNFDLMQAKQSGQLKSYEFLGLAHTPSFNPHRFKSYFVLFELSDEVAFDLDANEASLGLWQSAADFLEEYNQGQLLVVPPTLMVLQNLSEDLSRPWSIDFKYDEDNEVPCISSLSGVMQLMPLSNTLPPAERTNCFYLGDENSKKVLVDPSPKNKNEWQKLLNTLKNKPVDEIFLTHHHIDHRQYAQELALHFSVPLGMSKLTEEFINKSDPQFLTGQQIKHYQENDVLTSWKGQDLLVLEVPGHDNGQLALMPECKTWCLVGDLIQGIGTVVISRPEGNMAKYFASLEKIIALKPTYIYPSHGIGMGGVHRLEHTLEHRKQREEQVYEFTKSGLDIDQVLEKVYPGLDERLKPFAKVNILGHLDKLKEEGRL